ncbi:MAG: hypothetical protein Ct9H300mP4_04750 [Gammaproteobacteria bacterium]|nr:MAG: hypothetical protein Ct9H300mP4_04750 [Gammaproteobacteria bacterium]
MEDLNRSIDFYKQELGLKLIRSQQSQLWKMALMTTGEGEPILEFQEYIGPEEDPPPDGFSHLGVFFQGFGKKIRSIQSKKGCHGQEHLQIMVFLFQTWAL